MDSLYFGKPGTWTLDIPRTVYDVAAMFAAKHFVDARLGGSRVLVRVKATDASMVADLLTAHVSAHPELRVVIKQLEYIEERTAG